jgi:hypothetical protein
MLFPSDMQAVRGRQQAGIQGQRVPVLPPQPADQALNQSPHGDHPTSELSVQAPMTAPAQRDDKLWLLIVGMMLLDILSATTFPTATCFYRSHGIVCLLLILLTTITPSPIIGLYFF